MNQLRTEIRSCMGSSVLTDRTCIAGTFRFPVDFIGFRGHFPGQPVVPGICKIQAILVLCELHKDAPVQLREVVTAKFFAPAEAGDELTFDVVESPAAGDRYLVKTHISRGGERIARIDLLVSYGVVAIRGRDLETRHGGS